MSDRTPRTPHYVCFVIEARRLVSAGLFDADGGTRRRLVPIADPRDLSRDNREPVEVHALPGGKAVVSLNGQAIEAVSRQGLNGRLFWELACPKCSAAARKLYKPVGMDAYRCRECWRIARPSRSPRWAGVSSEEVARQLARALAPGVAS